MLLCKNRRLFRVAGDMVVRRFSNSHVLSPIPMHFIPIPIPFPSHGWSYSHSHGNPMGPLGSQSSPFPCTPLVWTALPSYLRQDIDRAYHWLLLALLDLSYSGALQISRWLIDWLIGMNYTHLKQSLKRQYVQAVIDHVAPRLTAFVNLTSSLTYRVGQKVSCWF